MANPIHAIVNYVKASIDELKKVAWPTKTETVRYSLLVMGISAGIAILIGALDFLFNIGVDVLVRIAA